ncbi:hypothetical protein NQZ79_g4852 [Umbelopsis isabellina]|nr:hypothetical protein NQZ79_g4852 [Umbelopsis isabellina]
MNDTATKPILSENQHSLQWSAFKPRAIASKPLNLTNFDNPLPFATINADQEKRKWSNSDDLDETGRKKHQNNSIGSPSSDGHSTDKGSVSEVANSSEAKARRKAQNRAAQRAFRERKEKYVQELEGKIRDMEAAHKEEKSRLLETNHNLMSLIQKLESEIASLKSKSPSFTESSGATKNPLSTRDNSGSPHSPENIGENNVARLTPGNNSVTEQDSNSSASLGSRYCGTTCRTTKDGISFCAKLKEEVCSSAFERLLSEHIFDNAGEVNNTIEPVPIVTSPISNDHKLSKFQETYGRETKIDDEYDLSSGTSQAFKHDPHPDTLKPGKELITCSQVWERLCEHPQFEEFDIEELCSQLKIKAKCSGSGPVIEEDELQEVLEALEAKLASDSMVLDDDRS